MIVPLLIFICCSGLFFRPIRPRPLPSPLRSPTPDSDDGFNIRKNKDRARRKRADHLGLAFPRASVDQTVSEAPDAPAPSANNKNDSLDPLSQKRLYNFLARNGYNISNKNLVNGAERHLRALVDLEAPTSAVDGPPLPNLKASAEDDHRIIDGGCTDDQINDGGAKEVEQQLHFYYLYDSMVYSGGPPVPGRSTAVEYLTHYHHT